MELLPILAFVRRRWVVLAVGAAAAIAVMILLLGRPNAGAGLARASVVLDSRPSQLIKPDPAGVETLGWRSSALANLMTSPEHTEAVARRLGVPKTDVLIINTVLAEPEATTAIARRAGKAASVAWEPYIVLLTARESLGMVAITAHARAAGMAGRAAQAAQDELISAAPEVSLLPPVEEVPVPGATPDPASPLAAPDVQERFVIEAAAPVSARTVTDSAGAMLGPIAAIALFTCWIAAVGAIETLPRIVRALRRRRRVFAAR